MKKILALIILIVNILFIVSCTNIDVDGDIDATFGNPNVLTTTSEIVEQETVTSNIDEPIEIDMIIQVEPAYISLNNIPDMLTITADNISDTAWHGGYHCAIDYFNGDEWELVYAPAYIDDSLIIEPNSTHTGYVSTDPDINKYNIGKYRVRFGFGGGRWYGWYGEFSITNEEEITEPETIESVKEDSVSESIQTEDAALLPKNVPVLMYHTSSEHNPGGLAELYVKPSEFEKQVQYLIEAGFTFCTFDDYYNLNNINKPIFLTFDDGYLENYTEIFPILQKYNAKITLFLMINSITPSNLTWEMVAEMSNSGLVKFESHTISHPSLVQRSGNDKLLTDELQISKEKIEEMTSKKVLALSYPNGEFNDIVKEKTKEFYSFGLRKDLGMHNTEYDPFEVRRIRINRSTSLETYIKLVDSNP